MISSTRLRNSGRNWSLSSAITRLRISSNSQSPMAWMTSLAVFEVMITTALRKSTVRP